jgi:hypothetical protein
LPIAGMAEPLRMYLDFDSESVDLMIARRLLPLWLEVRH